MLETNIDEAGDSPILNHMHVPGANVFKQILNEAILATHIKAVSLESYFVCKFFVAYN